MNAMKKEDRRVRYTKLAIRESFLALLSEKPIEKISVTEICKRADINRGTFYSHYDDIYSVAEFIHSQEGGKNQLMFGENGLFNLTKSESVKVENYFDNSDLNLLFAIIKESPKELILNGAALPVGVKKSLRPFAIINEAAKYD